MRVKKVVTPQLCKCGLEPKVCCWSDTIKPGKNATWIECQCGMSTKTFHSKDPQIAKDRCINSWNRSARRRKIKGGLRSCEKCGSNDVNIHEYPHIPTNGKSYNTYMIWCEGCGLFTDEITEDGQVRTKKEAKELWNS